MFLIQKVVQRDEITHALNSLLLFSRISEIKIV